MSNVRFFAFTLFFLVSPSLFLSAQKGTHVIQVDQQEQIEYIKRDTLPVEIKRLSPAINTIYSEYNPILFKDSTFYFVSLRPESFSDYEKLFDEFWTTSIYWSKLTMSGFSTPVPLPKTINNSKYYNCNFTSNAERSLLYFSRCLRDTMLELKCELWESKFSNNKWEKPRKLSRRINLPGTTTTQPFLVEYEDCNILYFVSNRKDGIGGLDIWYSVYKNGRFGDPINLGVTINTEGNEVTPFYDIEKSTLYFSSDRHNSIGGYDIFYSEGAFSAWKTPQNMGVPFNSSKHDFYFSIHPNNHKKGFFSSNRLFNSSFSDTCCHDIYQYEWLIEEKEEEVVAVDTIVDTISRVEKIRNLLPLTLFFQNDEPDPRSTDTVTSRNYISTLSDYLAMKEVYKQEYSKGLKNKAKSEAEEMIERFFVDSVQRGYLKLTQFSEYLLTELNEGKTVEITITGFASPLHKEEYNRRLSARRISSIKNYIAQYNNGVFLTYLNSKKLIIKSDPKGKTMASKLVSDNLQDKRNSVYSIAASLERKIQITEYKSK